LRAVNDKPINVAPRTSGTSMDDWKKRNPARRFHFHVDILGTCNLTCPSCPVGNSANIKAPTGHMSLELLDKILKKATAECEVTGFALYNWTEPLLHPKLPDMIRLIRSYEINCLLSANLNLIKNINAVMEANPGGLRITVSGFTQEQYGWTHRDGDIEVVKKNMAEVARAKERSGATTNVTVGFLRYLGNHDDELKMKEYATSLGFGFEPLWAYLMPLEKVLAYAEPDSIDVELTHDDRELINRLALPLDRSIEVAKKYKERPCNLRDRQMALNFRGEVMLCCTVYDQGKYKLANFLDTPLDELQDVKYRHSMCGSCMKHGLHVLATYGTKELDEIALANVAKQYPDARLIGMYEAMPERFPHGISGWPRMLRWKLQNVLSRLGVLV